MVHARGVSGCSQSHVWDIDLSGSCDGILLGHVIDCIHTQTGPWFTHTSEGVEGCHPCGCTGEKVVTHQLGWSPISVVNKVRVA